MMHASTVQHKQINQYITLIVYMKKIYGPPNRDRKALNKIQHPFMDFLKNLNKLGRQLQKGGGGGMGQLGDEY